MNTQETKQPKTRAERYLRFKEMHTDDINKQHTCDICFGNYTYFNKSSHQKTKKHLNAIEINKGKNEKDNKQEVEQNLINELKNMVQELLNRTITN